MPHLWDILFWGYSGFEITANEQPKPAKLKVLLGAIRVMVRSAISSLKEANGICFNESSRIKSQ